MKKSSRPSSLLAKYSILFSKNPQSRVYAPLAESYRKIGLYDKAMEVIRTGEKYHKDYLLGKIVKANCLYDLEEYQEAYNCIQNFISQHSENVALHRTFAKICEKLSLNEESLNSYKVLLLLNPKDQDIAKKVEKLEAEFVFSSEEKTKEKGDSLNYEDDWVQVSLVSELESKEDKEDHWQSLGQDQLVNFKKSVQENDIELNVPDINDEYYHEEYDNETDDSDNEEFDLYPTETLVDLYLQQDQKEKAIRTIDKILEEDPDKDHLLVKKNQLLNSCESPKENDSFQKIERAFKQFHKKIEEKFSQQ